MSNETADRWGKWLAIGGTLLAVVAIVFAIRIMGSPMTQRQARIDEKRVQDLDRIECAVRAWVNKKESLPANLDVLAQGACQDLHLRDPQTDAPYEYARIDADSFRLCAVFATDTERQKPEDYPASSGDWKHREGRQCFEFDLDKDKASSDAADLARAAAEAAMAEADGP